MLSLGSLGIKISQDVEESLLADVISKPEGVVETYAANTTVMKVANKMKNPKSDENFREMIKDEWVLAQFQDPTISAIVQLYKDKRLHSRKFQPGDSPGFTLLLKQRNQLVMRQSLLYRRFKHVDKESSVCKFVLPQQYRLQTIRGCHDDTGHL